MPLQLIRVHPDDRLNAILMPAILAVDAARHNNGDLATAYTKMAEARKLAREIGWDGVLRPTRIALH